MSDKPQAADFPTPREAVTLADLERLERDRAEWAAESHHVKKLMLEGFLKSELLEKSQALLALATTAREFVAYWLRDGGCGMCGGVPHSTTCFVGRMEKLIGRAR